MLENTYFQALLIVVLALVGAASIAGVMTLLSFASLFPLFKEMLSRKPVDPVVPVVNVSSSPATVHVEPSAVPVTVNVAAATASPPLITVTPVSKIDVNVASVTPDINVTQPPINLTVAAAQPLVTMMPHLAAAPLPIILRIEGEATEKTATVESAHKEAGDATTLLATLADEAVVYAESRAGIEAEASGTPLTGDEKQQRAIEYIVRRLSVVQPQLPSAMTQLDALVDVVEGAFARVYGNRQSREKLRSTYAQQAVAYSKQQGGELSDQKAHAYEAFKAFDLGDNKVRDFSDTEIRIAVDAAFGA